MPEEKMKDPELVRVYEIAYLVDPSAAEERALAALLPVKDLLAGTNASVVAEEAPRLRRLAYPIRMKRSGAASRVFDSAFFGWLRFETDTTTALAVKKLMESVPEIFRFLLIKPAKHAPFAAPQHAHPSVRRAAPTPLKIERREDAPQETPKPAVSDAELDRRIEELVGA